MADTDQKLIQADNTVVTAYFKLEKSKHKREEYEEWMSTMLRINDAMVIFTQPNMVNTFKRQRSFALNRTAIIPIKLEDLPLAKSYSQKFWQKQYWSDPEKRRHGSYQSFWIWLSKSYFVTEAVRANPFKSDIFVWSDIGCFRSKMAKTYKFKTMVAHREEIPSDSILFMAHKTPNPPPDVWWTRKKEQLQHFYHSGSQAAGNGDVWLRYHKAFMETVEGLIERKQFIGEDQPVAQSTCLQHPDLCAYVPADQVRDNNFFGLRHVLHHGGQYRLWRPPTQQVSAGSGAGGLRKRNISTGSTQNYYVEGNNNVTVTEAVKT